MNVSPLSLKNLESFFTCLLEVLWLSIHSSNLNHKSQDVAEILFLLGSEIESLKSLFITCLNQGSAAHKPSIVTSSVITFFFKIWIICLGTGLDIQLSLKLIKWCFYWGIHTCVWRAVAKPWFKPHKIFLVNYLTI